MSEYPLLRSLLTIATTVVVLLLVIFTFFQERLLFFPWSLDKDFKYQFDGEFEQHWIPFNGKKLDSLLFKVEKPKGTVLHFHGNAGALDKWGLVGAELAQRLGWNVWVWDYPGYGRSQGKIRSEEVMHRAAEAFYSHARVQLGPSHKVVIYGRSIGTGPATPLATKYPVAGLILESPFFSLRSLVRQVYPWVPLFLLKYNFRSDEAIARITAPILIVHGSEDELIPVDNGERLAKVAKSARFVSIPGGTHNDLVEFEEYWRAIGEFLERL